MKHNPQRALVITYSQTGQTEIYGRLIAAAWKSTGVAAVHSDVRRFDMATLASFDLIMVGVPVFYWDIPSNVVDALSAAPRLGGIPAASFVTYGGDGGNQHNTARRLLLLLWRRGGLPVGMETFGAISSFAPTWSMGNEQRVLAYRNRPDEETYDRVRKYAATVLERARGGTAVSYRKEFFAADFLRGRPSVAINKLMTGRHRIDTDACTGCGLCRKELPRSGDRQRRVDRRYEAVYLMPRVRQQLPGRGHRHDVPGQEGIRVCGVQEAQRDHRLIAGRDEKEGLTFRRVTRCVIFLASGRFAT